MCSRNVQRGLVTKTFKQFEIVLDDNKFDEAGAKFDRLVEMVEKLDELNLEAQSASSSEKPEEQCLEEEIHCEHYRELVALAKRKLDSQQRIVSKDLHTSSSVSMKLPKIALCVFSGTITEWSHFWEAFELLVHTTSLSNTEKFTYLRSALSGEAKASISGLSLTSDNYNYAIELLRKNYGDVDAIVRAHIRNLINVKDMSHVSKLPAFINEIEVNVQALRSLCIDESHYSVMATEILVSKLSAKMRFEWAKSTTDRNDVFKLIEFLRMQSECMKYVDETSHTGAGHVHENRGNKTEKTPFSQSSIMANAASSKQSSQQKDESCPKCAGTHRLDYCSEFKKLPVDKRVECVKLHRLCFNCLSRSHMSKQCLSKFRCRTCKKAHHTILHFEGPIQRPVSLVANSPTGSSDVSASSPAISQIATTGCKVASSADQQICLGTAVSSAMDCRGKQKSLRLMLDTGSDLTYIRESATVGLQCEYLDPELLHVKGFGEQSLGPRLYRVTVQRF